MFWKRKETPPAIASTAEADSAFEVRVREAEADRDAAVDAVASILRALGEHAIPTSDEPTESAEAAFERWATHVLVFTAPATAAESSTGGSTDAPPGRREWSSLVRFVVGHRRKEKATVTSSLASMRDAIMTMLRGFRAASLGQAKADSAVTAHVDRLRAAIETGSHEQLRAEALAVTEAVTREIEEQRRRAREQDEQLRGTLAALREQLDDAKRDGETDPLTRLFNRRAFDVALDRAVLAASVLARPVSLLLVDVDHFKAINDSHGHPAGDQVLRELANVLTRAFPRRSDVVARYGGEEFAVVLSETSLADASRLATRFLDTLRGLAVTYGDGTLHVTASVGVAELAEAEPGSGLVERADHALYRAKHAGRDRVAEAPMPAASGRHPVEDDVASKRRAAS